MDHLVENLRAPLAKALNSPDGKEFFRTQRMYLNIFSSIGNSSSGPSSRRSSHAGLIPSASANGNPSSRLTLQQQMHFSPKSKRNRIFRSSRSTNDAEGMAAEMQPPPKPKRSWPPPRVEEEGCSL